jgi:uncharacterized protein YcbX
MKVSELNIYPIKSLKGIRVDQAMVEDQGFQLDRRWMLVDDKNKFLTQREFPIMARIEVAAGPESLEVSLDGSRLSVPYEVPLNGGPKRVQVWGSSVKAEFYPGEVDEWFSNCLGASCRLAAMTNVSKRLVSPYYSVRKFRDTVSFADGYPYLLIGQASLDDLNSRLEAKVPMNRFRPNIVVEGSEAFAEDSWKRIRIGSTIFHVVKPSARCVITTIDQVAGQKTGVEPLRTMASYRTKRNNVLFGQNLIADESGGMIRIGDQLEVIESK